MIKQVKKNSHNGQLLIYVDKNSEFKEGDYVRLVKVEE